MQKVACWITRNSLKLHSNVEEECPPPVMGAFIGAGEANRRPIPKKTKRANADVEDSPQAPKAKKSAHGKMGNLLAFLGAVGIDSGEKED